MRVWENVAYPLRVRDVPLDERRRRAQEMLELVGLDGLSRAPAGAALRRAAAARRARARPRLRPARAAARRAAFGARRGDARGDARRDPPHPARAQHRLAPHHARPGRSALARRPHRRDARGPRSCRRARRRRSTTRLPTRSSPASSAAPICSTARRSARRAVDTPIGRLATPRTDTPPAARVRLLVRPERIEIASDAGGENVFAARVCATAFSARTRQHRGRRRATGRLEIETDDAR